MFSDCWNAQRMRLQFCVKVAALTLKVLLEKAFNSSWIIEVIGVNFVILFPYAGTLTRIKKLDHHHLSLLLLSLPPSFPPSFLPLLSSTLSLFLPPLSRCPIPLSSFSLPSLSFPSPIQMVSWPHKTNRGRKHTGETPRFQLLGP